MVLILSSPPAGSLPVQVSWQGLRIVWEGPDGSVWDLTDQAGGVVLVQDGLEGLHNPRLTKFSSTSRAVPGKRSRGWRAEAREVFWPLYVWGDGSAGWLERHDAFFSTIHPSNAGTWRVGAGGTERSLRLTGVFDDPYQFTRDPLTVGWALIPVTLEADQPFWEGQLIERGPWRAPDPQPFFPGPPFRISAGSAFGSATVPNPGDVEAYGVWWVRGPLSSVVLGVDGQVVEVPFEVPAGQMLRIDTDPRRPRAVMGAEVPDDELDTFTGTDMTRTIGPQSYAAVPPGRSVPLDVEATGAGAISFHLRPLYFRAF